MFFKLLSDKVMLNVDVLSVSMMNWVFSKSDTRLIVFEYDSHVLLEVQFGEQRMKPDGFFHCVCESHVFGFGGREHDGQLAFRRPANCAFINREHISRC